MLMFKTKYILYIFLFEISSKKYKKLLNQLLNHNVIMNVRKTKKIGILYIKKDPFRDKISSHSTESLKHYFDIVPYILLSPPPSIQPLCNLLQLIVFCC